MMNLCLLQLILSSCYIFFFLVAVIYMFRVNRCKFNKRTKVVITVLSLTMLLQGGASALTYIDYLKDGICGVYPLTYTILSQQHIIVIIIYSFLVCRMLSIYYKMSIVTLSTAGEPSLKARWALRLSQCQNPIILAYFLTYTAFLWTFHCLFENTEPLFRLTHPEVIAFICLMIPKIIYEMAILVIFICLFRRFNHLSQDYQTENRSSSSGSSFIFVAKVLCFFVCALYFINTIFFNVLSPLFWYFDSTRSSEG